MLDFLPGVAGTTPVTDEQRARLIHARMVVGAPVSASDSLWMYSRGKSSNMWPASPYSHFNPGTEPWGSYGSPRVTSKPAATTRSTDEATRAASRSEGLKRWKGAAEARVSSVGFWTAYGHPEYKGVYLEPSVPAGWTVESITKTPAGEPEIQLRLTNLEAALASGQTFPPEVTETYFVKKRYLKDVAVSKTAWEKLGYPQYGGSYTPPEVPSGYKIHSVTESDLGLSIEFEPIVSMQAKYGPAIANMMNQKYGQMVEKYSPAMASRASQLSQLFSEKYSPVIANVLTQRFNEKYGPAIANMMGTRYEQMVAKYSPAMKSRASQLSQLFVEKYTPAIANMMNQKYKETVSVSADEYFSQIYAHDINVPISPGSKDLPLIAPTLPEAQKKAYGEWLSSKRFWGEKGSSHYFPEYVGKYAPMSAEAVAAMGEGWQIEKTTETPEGLSIAWKQPPKSITQQISEFKVSDVGILRGFLTEEHKARADVLISEGKVVPQFVKPLASLEIVFAPVEGVVLGTAHLVAKVIGKDNPYFAAQPPATPFSAGVGLLTGSSAGVGELGKLEASEVVFRGLGDIWALYPTAKLAVDLAKQGASKLATKIEVWRYGAKGSEKWMESIRAGTIEDPMTGVTSYTGFAAKQASRLTSQISSLPFGTEKSVPSILASVSDETATEALDFAWGLGTTPKTTMFSISKLADPAYMRPSLPVYQMIGGSLVNVSEMVTSWGDPNAKFKMFPETKTAIERTSIQFDFEQLGFKDVITPKETPFKVQGFRDLPTGYSGSATQQLYMKASNVVSEVKSMFSDTGSAARMEMVFAKPSMSFMETSVQGISAGVSLPAARLADLKAASLTSTTLQEALASANLVTFGNLVERVSSGLPVKPEIAFFFTAGMDLRKSYAIPTLSTKDRKYPHTSIILPLQELGTSVTRAVISHEIGHATLFSLSLTREGKSIIQAKYGPPPAEWVHVPMSTVMYEKASSELAKKAGLSLQGKWLLGKAFRISKKTIKKEMKAGGLGLFPNAPIIMKYILASKTEVAISPSTLMKPTLKSNLWLTSEQGEPYYNPNKWLSSHGPVYPRRKPSEAISSIPNSPIGETVRTKLSTEFAFPISTGAFPVIPDISMSRQSARLETKQADMETYLSLSTKLYQAQAGSHDFYAPSALMTQQLTRLKPREGVAYLPKIASFLGGMEREDLMPLSMVGLASIPISAQVPGLKQISLIGLDTVMKSGFASSFGYTPFDITGIIPGVPFTFPRFPGSGSGGSPFGGRGKWFKITRPILEPKQVWKQFWGMPKLSVRRIGAKGKRSKVSVTRVGSRKKRSKRKK